MELPVEHSHEDRSTGELVSHRLRDLERRMDATLSREVFEAVMSRVEGKVDALTQQEAARRKQDDQRRNGVFVAVVAAVLSLAATLVLAGILVVAPGGGGL